MPAVSSSNAAVLAGALNAIKAKKIKTLCGFVSPDDGAGSPIPAILKNFDGIGKKAQHGLFLTADVIFCIGPAETPPAKYGTVVDGVIKGVKVHLCGKAACDHG